MTDEAARRDRIARNEALFRDVNERITQIAEGTHDELVEFLCECGDDDCVERIGLRRGEYESVRTDPVRFAVAHGHAEPELAEILDENERFQTVRKRAGEQAVARQTDPRS